MSEKITIVRLHPHLPGTNELILNCTFNIILQVSIESVIHIEAQVSYLWESILTGQQCLKIRTIRYDGHLWKLAWILIDSCLYYAVQTLKVYQVLPYSVDFKVPWNFEIHWVRQYIVNVVLFGVKDL